MTSEALYLAYGEQQQLISHTDYSSDQNLSLVYCVTLILSS